MVRAKFHTRLLASTIVRLALWNASHKPRLKKRAPPKGRAVAVSSGSSSSARLFLFYICRHLISEMASGVAALPPPRAEVAPTAHGVARAVAARYRAARARAWCPPMLQPSPTPARANVSLPSSRGCHARGQRGARTTSLAAVERGGARHVVDLCPGRTTPRPFRTDGYRLPALLPGLDLRHGGRPRKRGTLPLRRWMHACPRRRIALGQPPRAQGAADFPWGRARCGRVPHRLPSPLAAVIAR